MAAGARPSALRRAVREGLFLLSLAELRRKRLRRQVGPQRDLDRRRAVGRDGVADDGGDGVDRAPFETGAGHQGFASRPRALEGDPDIMQRFTLETVAERTTPVDHKSAIRGFERREIDTRRREIVDPAPVGPELRPGRAAEGEDRRIGLDRCVSAGRVESPGGRRRSTPSSDAEVEMPLQRRRAAAAMPAAEARS